MSNRFDGSFTHSAHRHLALGDQRSYPQQMRRRLVEPNPRHLPHHSPVLGDRRNCPPRMC